MGECTTSQHSNRIKLVDAAELRQCTRLEVLSLENNRVATMVVDLGAAPALRSLRLWGNPLEMLPGLGACRALRHLSLANARIDADDDLKHWTVEVRTVCWPVGGFRWGGRALGVSSQPDGGLQYGSADRLYPMQHQVDSIGVLAGRRPQALNGGQWTCRWQRPGATSPGRTSWRLYAASSSSTAPRSIPWWLEPLVPPPLIPYICTP